MRRHPLVSGTVGFLASVTLLSLFVFMGFTLVLIPVSLLGFVGLFLVSLYAYVSVGYLLGQRLPTEDPGTATAAGAVLFLVASRLLGLVPVVGDSLSIAVLVVAMGAVFVTYFGLREFHPPELGPVE
jgi:drug/metabolite transporter (DMT)-like permease